MTTRLALTGLLVVHVVAVAARMDATTTDTAAEPRAPERLVDTGLYENGTVGVLADANRPFTPQYPLWTDAAAKARWIYLPPDAAIDATNAARWEFPVGTRFWKEFRFGGRPVETRFIWHAAPGRWVLASYVWDAEGRQAVLAPPEGLPNVAPVAPGSTRRHSIPAVTDCLACHGDTAIEPLGFNALQLSSDRDPNAPHAEPLGERSWTVGRLVDAGRLRSSRSAIDPAVRITGDATTRALVGYLSTNCGSCHRPDAGVPLLGHSLAHRDVLDGNAVMAALTTQATSWQAPGVADSETRVLDPAAPDRSALLLRMRSRRPSSQMPAIGTVVADQAGIALVEAWLAAHRH